MRHKKGSNNNRNRGRGKFRSNNGGDSQSLARQKKHATTQKEKYMNMARDAQVNGERVDAEYYYQHVEHYSRVLAEIEAKEPKQEKREATANDDSAEAVSEDAGNQAEPSADATDEAQEAQADAAEKPARAPRGRRRAPAERKPSNKRDEEIPLPASVIPEAEPAEKAAASQ